MARPTEVDEASDDDLQGDVGLVWVPSCHEAPARHDDGRMCLDAARGPGPCPRGGARSGRGVGATLADDPVYIDPNAERALSDVEVDELRSAIRGANTPLYVAVLPAAAADAAGGDPAEVARQLAQAVDRPGRSPSWWATASGRAAASCLLVVPVSWPTLARGQGDDTLAVLADLSIAWVRRRPTLRSGPADPPTAVATAGDVLFPRCWSAVRRVVLARSRRRRAEAAERLGRRKRTASCCGQSSRSWPTTWSGSSPRCSSTPRHRATSTPRSTDIGPPRRHSSTPTSPWISSGLARVVAEARYAMDRERAILDGRDPPPPPQELQRAAPTASRRSRWTTPSTGLCRLSGRIPWRLVRRRGGGLFSGSSRSLLGGGFGHWGYGGTTIINQGDGGGDGGDWGGGDFGGGDFGGGDFGGGDFGGGDF